jgi:hypothetical protein
MCLAVPFDHFWRCTSGEKVDYALKKNQRHHIAVGLSRCNNSSACVMGKNGDRLFPCKTINDVLKKQPYLDICTSWTYFGGMN